MKSAVARNVSNGTPLVQAVHQDSSFKGVPLRDHYATQPTQTGHFQGVTKSSRGRFAPCYLGELTSIVPVELVDSVLEDSRAQQRRLRDLPSRAGAYFLLGMCLFPEVGYLLVWRKLAGGLRRFPLVRPSAKALRDLRRRIGVAPMRRLFEILCGPLAQPNTPGVRFGGYRTVSFDGCASIKVPDTTGNEAWLGIQDRDGYPMVELMTLVETGTRALIGAVFGPTRTGETDYARRLLHLLGPDMIVLWDKGFDANDFLAEVVATRAQVLGRLRSNRRTPIVKRLVDGSYLSILGTVQVRVIESQITLTCAGGISLAGSYRLVTTLTDARRYPASALVALYHERWEHESAYYALRHTLMRGRIMRSGDRYGLEQEMWSLLTLYQVLRSAMVDAAESKPGVNPDRCSFTIALQTARDLVIQGVTDAAGLITEQLLGSLMPERRFRVSLRKVKSPVSRYNNSDQSERPRQSRTVTSLSIDILVPEDKPAPPVASRDERYGPRVDLRSDRILDFLRQYPERPVTAVEIAAHFGDIVLNTMYRQLSRWAKRGLIHKIGRGCYIAQTEQPNALASA